MRVKKPWLPLLVDQPIDWWQKCGEDFVSRIYYRDSHSTIPEALYYATNSRVDTSLITSIVEQHFRRIDSRQFLVRKSSLRARAYATAAGSLATISQPTFLGYFCVKRYYLEHLLEIADNLLDIARTTMPDSSPYATSYIEAASASIMDIRQTLNTQARQPTQYDMYDNNSESLQSLRSRSTRSAIRIQRQQQKYRTATKEHRTSAASTIQRWHRRSLARIRYSKRDHLRLLCRRASAYASIKIKATSHIQCWYRCMARRISSEQIKAASFI